MTPAMTPMGTAVAAVAAMTARAVLRMGAAVMTAAVVVVTPGVTRLGRRGVLVVGHRCHLQQLPHSEIYPRGV